LASGIGSRAVAVVGHWGRPVCCNAMKTAAEGDGTLVLDPLLARWLIAGD
jgi:hypothetical protein